MHLGRFARCQAEAGHLLAPHTLRLLLQSHQHGGRVVPGAVEEDEMEGLLLASAVGGGFGGCDSWGQREGVDVKDLGRSVALVRF